MNFCLDLNWNYVFLCCVLHCLRYIQNPSHSRCPACQQHLKNIKFLSYSHDFTEKKILYNWIKDTPLKFSFLFEDWSKSFQLKSEKMFLLRNSKRRQRILSCEMIKMRDSNEWLATGTDFKLSKWPKWRKSSGWRRQVDLWVSICFQLMQMAMKKGKNF